MPKTKAAPLTQEEQRPQPLEYDVRIYPSRADSKQKASATVNINGAFALTNIRVVEGSKGLFVAMPQYRGRNGEYKDLFFPCTKESRAAFDRAVLDAYQQTMAQSQTAAPQEASAPQEQGMAAM